MRRVIRASVITGAAALLQPGDTILGMSLDAGGHLTHGAKPNFSGKIYNAVQYGLNNDTGEIDYAQVEALAKEHQPKMVVAGFSAYSRVVDWQRFRDIADSIGAYLFVDMAHVAGLIAVGLYPSPVNIADVTTTTTHKTLRGPRGGLILAKANEVLEKKFNSMIFPGIQGGPLMHVIAAKAVAFKEALEPSFKDYQQQVLDNARAMAGVFLERSYNVVSGGTDDHLFLVDLIDKGITGKQADAALGAANITVKLRGVSRSRKPVNWPAGCVTSWMISIIRMSLMLCATRRWRCARTSRFTANNHRRRLPCTVHFAKHRKPRSSTRVYQVRVRRYVVAVSAWFAASVSLPLNQPSW